MKVPYYKSKKRARRFFRKNTGSLIIHENGFWPFLAKLSSFAGSFCLLLHILIDRIDHQVPAVIKLLGRVINYAKLAYYMQKRAQNESFSHGMEFDGFSCKIESILKY